MTGQQLYLLFIEVIAIYLLVIYPAAKAVAWIVRRIDERSMPVPPAVRRIPTRSPESIPAQRDRRAS